MSQSPAEELLARLVEIARLIEEHQTAVFLLDQERLELRMRLGAAGWKPPSTEAAA